MITTFLPRRGAIVPLDAPFSVNWDSPQSVNLMAWWPTLNVRNGLTIYDIINHHDITLNSSWQPNSVMGAAPTFNGTTQYGSVPLDLSSYNKIALTFWMSWDAFANTDNLAFEFTTNFNNNPGGFLVDPNSGAPDLGGFQVKMVNPTASAYNGGHFTRPTAIDWHQYVLNFDIPLTSGSICGITVFVDGAPQAFTATGPQTNQAGSFFANSTLYIMSRATTSLFGAGKMADIRLYVGKTLSADEAFSLYAPQTRWELYKTPTDHIWPAVPAGGTIYNDSTSLARTMGFITDTTVIWADSISLGRAMGISLVGNINTSDAIALARTMGITVNGGANIVDSISLGRTMGISVSGQFDLAAAISLARTMGINVTNTQNIVDAISLARNMAIQLNGSVDFQVALTLGILKTITTDGVIPTPSTIRDRIYQIAAEGRTFLISAEGRTFIVDKEGRIWLITEEK